MNKREAKQRNYMVSLAAEAAKGDVAKIGQIVTDSSEVANAVKDAVEAIDAVEQAAERIIDRRTDAA